MIRMFSHHFQLGTLLLAALNAACLGLLGIFVYFLLYPAMGTALLNTVPGAIAIAFAVLALLARFSFNRAASSIVNRRVLILGVGRDAAMVKEALDNSSVRGLSVVGFYSIDSDQQVEFNYPRSS